MKFKQGDILTRNKTIWLNSEFVANVCDFTENMQAVLRNRYKRDVTPCHRHHNVLPDTGKSWRWAKINNKIYYALSNIPNRKPMYYRDMFGDAETLVENYNQALKNRAKSLLESEFSAFIQQNYKYHLSQYPNCNALQRPALAKACAVLQFTADYIVRNEIADNKINKLIKEICALIKEKDMRYLPTNYRRFREKFDQYASGSELSDIIVLPRKDNKNALVFDDPELRAAALKLRSYGQNYTNEYIIRKVQDLCRIKGRRVPNRRWFGQNVFELNETKFLTDHLRYGEGSSKAFSNTGYIPLERALYSGDCWEVDATRVNLIEHKKEDGKSGHLNIVAVRDVHSGDILGYALDYSENRFVYANALKMAVENAGYLPYELIVDRFPGHNTKEMVSLFDSLKKLGTKVNITSNANGKAGVERGFSTLQTVFMQDSLYYYGEGIKSRNSYAHRSPEYLKEVRKQAKQEKFDLTASYNESIAIVEAYRSTPLSYYSRKHDKVDRSPAQIHQESEKPNVRKVSGAQISMLFGLKKKATIKHDGMIRTEIHKVDYVYQISDYELMKKHKSVILSYDLEDLSTVHVFRENDGMLIHVTAAKLFNKPTKYGPDAEWNRITTERHRLQQIKERKSEDLELQTAVFSEVDFMMGRFTSKTKNETERILSDTRYEQKRTANSDIQTGNASDIDLDDFITSQM
ncbi:Mu transposase C-terminal domain-containing protein [Aquimarina latercula]|uniref:Mu transposase C-terminal domain-containing protein n=1 Tax=Aquimarina latercula TaxID=987 RepID=UPI000408E739|nr:Mu transposase C-terminal domain-containing protein [Aquimarina latercula]